MKVKLTEVSGDPANEAHSANAMRLFEVCKWLADRCERLEATVEQLERRLSELETAEALRQH